MPRPRAFAAELERRRRRAVALIEAGEDRATVARILGIHPKTLDRWLRLSRTAADALTARPLPGPTRRLSEDQLRELEALLRSNATEHGWATPRWTAARVAVLIERHFHVRYHPEHVRKLLKRCVASARRKATPPQNRTRRISQAGARKQSPESIHRPEKNVANRKRDR